MNNISFRAPWLLTLVFVVVLSFLMTGSISAQDGQNEMAFNMPYRITRLTGGCHPDGWLVAGVSNHCAIDIANDYADGILATTNGVVQNKGVDPYMALYNTFIWIVGDGCYDTYMLHGIYDQVSIGDRVQMGQRIGTQANIGASSTGPHTHLSVYNKCAGRWVDPRTAVSGEASTLPVNPASANTAATTSNSNVVVAEPTAQPQQPINVVWHTQEEIDNVFAMEREALASEEVNTLIEPNQIPQNPLKLFLGRLNVGVWSLLVGLLMILVLNRSSRSLSIVWIFTILVIAVAFFWSKNVLPTVAISGDLAANMAEHEVESIATETPENEGKMVFPDLPSRPIPPEVVDALENPVVVQQPLGSNYFPDPGPSMVRTVEILTEIAEERGMPPQFFLSKVYFEGVYQYNGSWYFLRNWKPDGSMTKSSSYADCRGIGQVCKYWHPAFDQVRAGDLNDPEEALRYSAGFAADFLVYLFNETGNWSSVVMRYHGTQVEGQKGLDLTRQYVVDPPLNPETGMPAWPAASIDIMAETSLRPLK